MDDETYPRTENNPPPSGRIVAALYQDPDTGSRHRIRAVHLRSGHWEAGEEVFDDTPNSFWDWYDDRSFWPEGWYETSELPEPMLVWLPEGSVLAWREFPTFDVPESKESRQ